MGQRGGEMLRQQYLLGTGRCMLLYRLDEMLFWTQSHSGHNC